MCILGMENLISSKILWILQKIFCYYIKSYVNFPKRDNRDCLNCIYIYYLFIYILYFKIYTLT